MVTVPPGEHAVVRVRLYDNTEAPERPFGSDFDQEFEARKRENDEYYSKVGTLIYEAKLDEDIVGF